jgi:hypothetical protein
MHENIFLIYMYICHIASKTEYSKYEIDIFYSIKKNSDLKINMAENHKSLSLFIFWRKKKVCLAWSLAQASDPAGHKKGAVTV